MSATTVRFSPTGTIQTYSVTTAGTYLIEAAGAQGGPSAGPGMKGARVSGMFYLKRGDILKLVAGSQGTAGAAPHRSPGGRGGSSLVWMGSSNLPEPIKLMLSARGGKGGTAAGVGGGTASAGGGDGTSPDLAGFADDAGELDQPTIDTLATQWTRAAGSPTTRPAGGTGRADRGGYNAGAFPTSAPEVQEGGGYVSIGLVSVPTSSGAPDPLPTGAVPVVAKEQAPANAVPGAGGGDSKAPKPAPSVGDDSSSEVPSQTILPKVTPRPSSWANLLRRRRRR